MFSHIPSQKTEKWSFAFQREAKSLSLSAGEKPALSLHEDPVISSNDTFHCGRISQSVRALCTSQSPARRFYHIPSGVHALKLSPSNTDSF